MKFHIYLKVMKILMKTIEEFQKCHFHFIGIGGVGMSALAKACLKLGASVSGSDLTKSQYTKQLEEIGAKIHYKHEAKNIKNNIDYIVLTPAIKNSNLEKIAAEQSKIKTIMRSDLLQCFVDLIPTLAVAGAHGKTTTSSMLSYVLQNIDSNSAFLIGGISIDLQTNSIFNSSPSYLAIEADESDGSLIKYNCDSTILTNIDHDHVDYYKTFDDVIDVYRIYCKQVKNTIVTHYDEKIKYDFLSESVSYSASTESAEFFVKNIKYNYDGVIVDLYTPYGVMKELKLNCFGIYNIENCLAVIALLTSKGFLLKEVTKYLSTYSGVKRRFEILSNINDCVIIDDYAHHPSEIKNVTTLLESHFKNYKKIALFEPHRVTRFNHFKNEFYKELNYFDEIKIFECFEVDQTQNTKINSFRDPKFKNVLSKDLRNLLIEKDNTIYVALSAGILSNSIRNIINEKK